MVKNKTIKVIKRSEREAQETAVVEPVIDEKKNTQIAAREVVATVTNWVNEFQQKRRTETAQAFKTLFSETTPQPSKA